MSHGSFSVELQLKHDPQAHISLPGCVKPRNSFKTQGRAVSPNKHGVSGLISRRTSREVNRRTLFTASVGKLITNSRVHVELMITIEEGRSLIRNDLTTEQLRPLTVQS